MAGTKFHKAVIQKLAPFGWSPVGIKGNSHLLMRHTTGLTFDVPSSPRNEDDAIQVAVQRARRLVSQGMGEGRKFVDWLLEDQKVPMDGVKDVELRISEKAAEYIDETGSRVKPINMQQAASADERVEMLLRSRERSRYRLYGTYYGVTPNPDLLDASTKQAQGEEESPGKQQPKREKQKGTPYAPDRQVSGAAAARSQQSLEREQKLLEYLEKHGPTVVDKVREITGINNPGGIAKRLGLRAYRVQEYQGKYIYALPTHEQPENTTLVWDYSTPGVRKEGAKAAPEPEVTPDDLSDTRYAGDVEDRTPVPVKCLSPHPHLRGVICTDEKGHPGMHHMEGTRNRWPAVDSPVYAGEEKKPKPKESPKATPDVQPDPVSVESRASTVQEGMTAAAERAAAAAAQNGPPGIDPNDEAQALFRRMALLMQEPVKERAEDAETRLGLVMDELDTIDSQLIALVDASNALRGRIAELQTLASNPAAEHVTSR